MKNAAKWLLMLILKILNTEATIDLIIKVLTEVARRTENKIDDACVLIIAEMLYSAFGFDTKEKMDTLNQQFE